MSPSEFRKIRERLELKQKELADILGVSDYMTISHYETGFRTPSVLIMALMRIIDEWPEKRSMELRDELKTQIDRERKRKSKKA